jgi:hypothetical protein
MLTGVKLVDQWQVSEQRQINQFHKQLLFAYQTNEPMHFIDKNDVMELCRK